MVLVYATQADLTGEPWALMDPPANVDRLLRQASALVRRATRTAVYTVETTGLPTDADVLAGFRDATCAQVVAWVDAGISDPATAASTTSGAVASKSLGPRSISYAGADLAAAAWVLLTRQLTAEAMSYLTDLPIWPGVQVAG